MGRIIASPLEEETQANQPSQALVFLVDPRHPKGAAEDA